VRWLPEGEIAAALDADVTAVALLPIGTALAHAGLRSLAIGSDGAPWLEQRMTVRWIDAALKDFAVRLAERIDVPAPPLTTIVFTGDIIPSRCVYERQRNQGDYTAAFAFVEDYLRVADITVGSLDASISDAGEPYACEETFNLLGPPESVEGFVAAGFDVVTVATNHAKDCGSAGFGCSESIRDTLAYLRGAGIEPVGGGENLAEARRPAVIERNGIRFAFLGYDDIASIYYGATDTIPGTAPLSEESLRDDIALAKSMADVVIVLPQWGIEYTPYPSDRQVYLGRVALEAGATLVIGNHPHVVEGVETGPGRFLAYALGNFVFDQDWSIETLQGAVLEATFAGDQLLGVKLKPHRIRNMFQPSFVEPDEARVILDRMRDASEYVAGR
jgi:poly-gamma-glutamate synthesis protein (capsule biosynthesis protein)